MFNHNLGKCEPINVKVFSL